MKFLQLAIVFAFLVNCKGNSSSTSSGGSTACTTCRIFLSATTTTGDFGSVSAADAICMADANLPSGSSTFKALLALGTSRRACSTDNCSGGSTEHIDWVLKANTTYTRVDGTVIGTTDANGLLGSTITNSVASSGTAWTGINYTDSMGVTNRWTNAGNNCSSWTSNSGTLAGEIGLSTQTSSFYVDDGSPVCSSSYGFYCVEQ